MNLKKNRIVLLMAGEKVHILFFCLAHIARGQVAWRYDLHAKGAEPRKCYLGELVFILSRFRRVNIPEWRHNFPEMKLDFHVLCDSCLHMLGMQVPSFSICNAS